VWSLVHLFYEKSVCSILPGIYKKLPFSTLCRFALIKYFFTKRSSGLFCVFHPKFIISYYELLDSNERKNRFKTKLRIIYIMRSF